MNLKSIINKNSRLKQLALRALMPAGQARPRLWVQCLLFPLYIKKGKKALIRRRVRLDVFPFNEIRIGKKSTIEDFSTVNNGVGRIKIGNRTRIGIGSVLIGPVVIGNDVRLAQNVVISALNHNYTDISSPISEQGVNIQEVTINDESWIGANAVLLPGVSIGKHSIVAAGSVVTKPVPDYTIVAGNPAKAIKQYNAQSKSWERINC